MRNLVEVVPLAGRFAGSVFFVVLLCSSMSARAKSTARCNVAAVEPVSFISLPGHPFSTIASKDGCWLFVSVTSANPRSANGVAMLRRADGRITLQKFSPSKLRRLEWS